MVHLASRFARIQPLVAVRIIQVEDFPALSQSRNVLGVPTVWCEPGPIRFAGNVPAPYFAAQILQSSLSAST